jgi:PAS domain S-box-containing protein
MPLNKPRKLFSSLKIIIPLWITFLLFIISIFFVLVPSMEENILNQKREMIRNLADTNLSLLSEYYQMVLNNEITEKAAQSEAIRQIRGLRYGPEGKDYFWINDMHPKMIMHPYFSELEGDDLTNFADPNGKHLFVEAVKIVRNSGGGYINYMWQWKDDPEKIVPKISYVKEFKPWGWIIGTGIYIEDVHSEIGFIIKNLLKIFAMILVIIILLSSYITFQAIKNQRKRFITQKALSESEKRFRNLSDLTFEGMLFHDKGIAIDVNKSLTDMFGYTRKELVGKNLIKLLIPEESQSIINKFFLENSVKSYEATAQKKDGTIIPIEIESKNITDNNVTFRATAIRDITKRKQTEKALLESENNYRSIFDNTGTATVIIEENMIISLANDKFVELSGYSRGEIEGNRTWTEFVLPEDLATMKEQHEKRRIKGEKALKTYEFRFIDRNKNIKHILLSVDVISGTKKSISSLLDITERKKTEQELQTSHARFLTVLNSIDATIYVSDMKTHNVIFMNQNMIDSFGRDATGDICHKVFRNEDKPCSICTNNKLLDKNNKPTGVHTWQDKNPVNKKWYINHDRAIEWEKGRFVKLQIATDITYLKNMEKELSQAHKMESIGTLAGGIAHDFNNILFPIIGHTELLLQDQPKDDPSRETLKKIYASALRAKDLVKQILTFSRQDVNEFKVIRIQPIIEEALKFIRSSIPTTISINQEINEDCGLIKADPTQIHQIVMNLATNAYHAMEETGGEIRVNLTKIDLQKQSETSNPDILPGIYALLTIADTGTGIDKEVSEKIFDPFFTTKKLGKGTGLGLSVVHGIVKSMNGAIQMESEPGKGTEFQIFLPVNKASSMEQAIITKKPILKGSEQVLLVDDEIDIVTMEKKMLEHFGYKVTAHTDSTEALEVFRSDPDQFDLVITDMAMPNMQGDKLSAELTKIRRDIPVLLCTGYSEIMSEEKAVSLGIDGFLMKPVGMKDLADKIRKVLD